MGQSVHQIVARHFMDHSQLELDESFISAENGFFKCSFTVGLDEDAVRISMQYIVSESDDSWIAASAVIGPMGEVYNLLRMVDHLNSCMVPSYTLSREKRGRILFLSRSFCIDGLNPHRMNELTYGLAGKVRELRRLMA